ncbi:MAG TPA: crosslink repair DNA glycosylase YcaQ family protein [Kofleriaceae bacterium]|nr:crosslink repair DNA glycosylase YcaQ family protein [Kofleriaceae bacterium]
MKTAAGSWTLAQARALWWQKQAIGDATRTGALATVIGETGWLRTLGGSDVYIAARARRPELVRGELDAAVAAGELCVVPAARGCIYLVPAGVVGDLMALNAEGWRKATERDLAKAGSSMQVVEALAQEVLGALERPLSTEALRKALPAGAIPSFGEAGKKIGLSSPLPLALRLLEQGGRVERTLEGGRLDSDRYLWRRAPGQGKGKRKRMEARGSEHPIDTLAGAFLGFAGPATLAQLAAWSGRAQRELMPSLERLGAVAITVEGLGEAWVLPDDLEAVRGAPPPSGLALLAFEDNYLAPHGLGVVSDPRHHAIQVDLWGSSKPEAIGAARHVLSRTIVVDGLIAGFWEVDPRSEGATWMTFDPAPKALARQIEEETLATARFLLRELGHARVFTLDTMDLVQERADRIAKLRDGVRKAPAKAAKAPAKPAKKR